MKFSTEKPPNWNEICKHFSVDWNKGVIVTYGDTVHCISDIGEQKEIHEAIHIPQQLYTGVDKWWSKYFEDPKFRLSQEMEAYKAEVKWVRNRYKDRNTRFKVIRQICLDISSKMYGSMISYEEATKLLNL